MDRFIDKIRHRENWFYRFLYDRYKGIIRSEINYPKSIGSLLYSERQLRHRFLRILLNKFYYEPMLRSRCTAVGKKVRTDGDIPLIVGSGRIIIGDNVHIGNHGAWIVAPNIFDNPELIIGSHCSINYWTVISVEQRVEIGDHCAIAGKTMIFDNSSHGIHFENGRQMTRDDVAPVKIEDHVWIGTGSLILKGVTIGKGAVVGAASVVTKDIPPRTIVAGNPARIVKEIPPYQGDVRKNPLQ
jgi:acetyltransferase-like isoleucine patch superfamily enzyme